MATEVRRRRGTTIEHSTFTGAVAELTVDLTKDTVVVHDGATQGGFPLLREDFSNVPTTVPFTNISLDTAIFDTTYSADGNEAQGTLYWNEDELTLSLVTNGQTTELGQKVEVHVKNQTGAQINKGEVVYASGTVGSSGRITVTKMIADGTISAKRVVGVAAENIANGDDGKVVHFGKIRKVNTDSYDEGDILWVSTTTAGAFQNTEPVQADGELALPIAFVVTKSINNGELFVRINAIDENEYTDYADYVELRSDVIENHLEIESLQDNKVELGELFPDLDKQALGTGDSVTFGGLTVNGNISVTGTVDGRDVAADGADLDELYTTIGLSALTSDEVDQLENIDSVTISNTQWGYLGELDQPLKQADSPTFNRVVLSSQADDGTKALRADREVNAGNGLTGGGALTSDQTLTLGTPGTTTVGGSNAVTTDSHTHALDLSGRSITLSDDSDGVLTFDTNTQNLGADRTYTPTIADHASGQRGVLSTGAQDIYGSKTFINNLVADANVGTSDFVSQTTGWNVTSAGAADFRSLYSDEIRTEAFIAEISEALVGADFLTKSRGVLSRNFTIPSNGNTGTLYVEDLEGFEGTQVFSDNDWLRLRVIDKSGGGLVVVDVWGQVTSYTDLSGGEQSWTFTTDDDGGSSGSVIYAGSVALDYGQSGDGFIVRTTLDSQGSPYSQVVRWTNTVSGSPDPNDADTTYTVLTRTGELGGIASLSGAGLYAKDRVYFDFGDADIFQIGKDVGGAGSHGVRIDTNNYWYGTGDFKVSNGTQFLELSSGDLTGTFGDITFSSDSFTLTAGSMTIDSTDGVVVDANNFFKQDSTFSFGGGLLSGTSSTLAISGSGASIDVDTFTLDAGTAYLSSSGTPIMALDTSDASTANISTGTGFYADGAGNLRIGDSDTYLKFDTTNGLQIKIGNDDLSTAIADIRSDLIDIYLGNESTFSGIQFLSGQLVLKAGTGNSIASITLDGTQEDVSTISLDADYIVVTGTTIFKSAKDGSTTPDTLGDATFIDGGTIVTNSITATEIAANTITASEIAAGTITANEIDVADLFAEDATVTGLLTIGSGSTIKLGNLATATFGLEINTNNYWKLQTGIYSFKVGDANNFISFNTSSNVLDITTDTFDLATTNLSIDSANELITIGSASQVSLGFKNDLDADGVGIEFRDTLDKYASTVDFYGLYLDTDNYFGFVIDNDGNISDGYNFRVGGASSNYIEVNAASGDADVNFDTFDLTSGNLRIKSGGTTYPSANTGNTSNAATTGNYAGVNVERLDLTINSGKWIKFQFDYDHNTSGTSNFQCDFTVEIQHEVSASWSSIGVSDDIFYLLNPSYAYVDVTAGASLSVTDDSTTSQTKLRFQSASASHNSYTGTITFYFYVFDKGSTDALRLNFIDNSSSINSYSTDIDGIEYNPVTELNPNGIFVRLADSLVNSNGNTYQDISLITNA